MKDKAIGWIIQACNDFDLDPQKQSDKDMVCIIMDLSRQNNEKLSVAAFDLLIRFYEQKIKMVTLATQVQLSNNQGCEGNSVDIN